MARTRIPVTGIGRTGSGAPALTAVDTVNGSSVSNADGRTILIVTNAGGAPHTLTVRIPILVDGQSVIPRTYSIPAGATRYLGTFDNVRYSPTLQVDADSTDLQVGALRFGESLPGEASADPVAFAFSTPAVVADLGFDGLTTDGNVLVVDTVLTASTTDGDVLVVTV
ncbi:MAG: hypothetical protein ABW022_08545 [Actinoplanes sp.]